MGAGAYLGFRSADTVEELDPTQLANLAALTNDEGGSDYHYANGYKQWKIEKPWPWSDAMAFYDCCANQVVGYSPSGECK